MRRSASPFDRNQGNVAIARATRAQLQADYAARLVAATGSVGALLQEYEQLATQLAIARRDLPARRTAAARAQAAFGASNIDERGLCRPRLQPFREGGGDHDPGTRAVRSSDRIQTLVGDGLPTIDLPGEPAGDRPVRALPVDHRRGAALAVGHGVQRDIHGDGGERDAVAQRACRHGRATAGCVAAIVTAYGPAWRRRRSAPAPSTRRSRVR